MLADRKMIRYRSQRPPDTELRARLRELTNHRRRFGYRRLYILLRDDGEASIVSTGSIEKEGLAVRNAEVGARQWDPRANPGRGDAQGALQTQFSNTEILQETFELSFEELPTPGAMIRGGCVGAKVRSEPPGHRPTVPISSVAAKFLAGA